MCNKIGLLVPFYNHGQFSETLLKSLLAYGLTIIIIDDGSDVWHKKMLEKSIDSCKSLFSNACIFVDSLEINGGKGEAVMRGFQIASDMKLTHVIQIDADCQHDFSQISAFINACQKNPAALICGYPVYDSSVPKSRLYPRYITHFWVWINTLSFVIKDSMCGFRCYPIDSVLSLYEKRNIAKRMDFDIDIIVRLYWVGTKIVNLPVRVIYHEESSSHFRLWADNVLISKVHACLFFGMLKRIPSLICRRFFSDK